jgi:hypothetical protein
MANMLSPLPLQSVVDYRLCYVSILILAFRELQLATREVFKITGNSDTIPPPAFVTFSLQYIAATLLPLFSNGAHCDCKYFVVLLQ